MTDFNDPNEISELIVDEQKFQEGWVDEDEEYEEEDDE